MAEDSNQPNTLPPRDPNEDTRHYWARLDAKFATIHEMPAPPPAASPEPPVSPPPVSPPPVVPASDLIADAFAALLALEDGQPGAKPVRLTIGDGHPTSSAAPVITDAVIEDIVRRVVERLGPDAVRAVVVDVVSQISERLVKEEIERIRNQHG
jgi:hypothetical protein